MNPTINTKYLTSALDKGKIGDKQTRLGKRNKSRLKKKIGGEVNLFTILKSQSHTRLNRPQNFPKSYKNKPTPSHSSVTSSTVVHNTVGKEGENASAKMMPKTVNNQNYKKTENLRGTNNQTQTKRQEKKSYTNRKYIKKTSLLLFA